MQETKVFSESGETGSNDVLTRKLRELLSFAPGKTPNAFVDRLVREIQGKLLNLEGDSDRDLEKIQHEGESGHYVIEGFWGQTRRLHLTVDMRREEYPGIADIMLKVTREDLDTESIIYGDDDPQGRAGNNVFMARLLHVAIFSMRKEGVMTLTNDPATPERGLLFMQMGFENEGRVFRLLNAEGGDDLVCAETALEFIQRRYKRAGRELSSEHPVPFEG